MRNYLGYVIIGAIAFVLGNGTGKVTSNANFELVVDEYQEAIEELKIQNMKAIQIAIKANADLAIIEEESNKQVQELMEKLENYEEDNCAMQPIPSDLLNSRRLW